MAMRLTADHSVQAVGAASAAVTGASLLAVQWLGEGGAIAAGVALVGALITFTVAWLTANRQSFQAQVAAQAKSFELAMAELRRDNESLRRDNAELRADLDEARHEIAQLRSIVNG